jgi:hypothetical protein
VVFDVTDTAPLLDVVIVAVKPPPKTGFAGRFAITGALGVLSATVKLWGDPLAAANLEVFAT